MRHEEIMKFYLSHAKKENKILEPLCGSGRFLIPFLEKGFNISGIDLSKEMLEKLRRKAHNAQVTETNILEYNSKEKFDYIFITSGSLSLLTDINEYKKILRKMKDLLNVGGKFVFAVDTIATRCSDDTDYKVSVSVKTKEGFDLLLKNKNYYDEKTQTQFSPSIYELYDGAKLIQREYMNFQTHLYELGEMEQYLYETGFTQVTVYCSFEKTIADGNQSEMFLYECGFGL